MSHSSPDVLLFLRPFDSNSEFSYVTFFIKEKKEAFEYNRALNTDWIKQNTNFLLKWENLDGKSFRIIESPWYPKCSDKFSKAQKRSVVYFVQSAIGGPIKIGQSLDPQSRLKELQTGSPFELRLLAVTSNYTESELHSQFSFARLHGEWFEPVCELLDLIKSTKGE